ncbi:MAG: cupin domain-containing protein [Actinobacteria bacterium]|nr:cupin domain-containing protein [Actinomycetota bacterium]
MNQAAVALELVPEITGSSLALSSVRVRGDRVQIHEAARDTLLYVVAGAGSLVVEGESANLVDGSAALILSGERATVERASAELVLLQATVGLDADQHAPMGARARSVDVEDASTSHATGARSFRVLFGPHNGSTRATLFAGYLPPGRAPWHYHLYDEIVWVPEGPGRVLRRDSDEALEAGAAFRLRPREVHIVENSSPDQEMTVLGFFTPAGSPAAAYLANES